MKTKNNYPENANKAKAFFVAGLILIQVTLLASGSSLILKDSDNTVRGYSENIKCASAQNAGNACDYLLEEAKENEFQIEDWMYNTQNSFWLDLDDAKEYEQPIEDWMCNTRNSFWFDLDDAKEYEQSIEDWMYNTQNSFWFDLNDAKEYEHPIENWMTNPKAWRNTNNELMLTSK
jgi:hypothetical protein